MNDTYKERLLKQSILNLPPKSVLVIHKAAYIMFKKMGHQNKIIDNHFKRPKYVSAHKFNGTLSIG